MQFCSAEVMAPWTPPKRAAVTTDLARVWTPPPQMSEQAPQPAQPERTQSMGHFCSLHVRYSTFAGQPIPPWPAAVVIERERDCVPRAQLALHTVQLLQAVYWQSMGHAKALHDLVLEVLGQATPPCWVAVTTDRLRDFEPPPHDFEQLENADQLETLQSIALGVGAGVGYAVGYFVGDVVGYAVGTGVGYAVGDVVGKGVGYAVGAAVISVHVWAV